MPVADRERALHQRRKRDSEEERERPDGRDDDHPFPRRAGTSEDVLLAAYAAADGESPLEPQRDRDGQADAEELDQREHGGRVEVERADGLGVDLDLERRVRRAHRG